MPFIVYRSSDVGAPQMTAAAGSLLTVLDACLVNGYGSKAAAGWGKTVIDAATRQATYAQGAVAGLAQRKLYVKDDASAPGNATAWGCADCTVSPTPTLTNSFWTQGNTYAGVITKADQESGGKAAWIIIATERWFYLLTKRSCWGSRGYMLTFFGDLDSPYPNDKGKCAVMGWNTNSGPALALDGAARAVGDTYICAYGNQDGTVNFFSRAYTRALGDNTGMANAVAVKSPLANGLVLGKLLSIDTDRLRGSLPKAYRTLQSLDVFSYYMLPDNHTLQTADASKTLLHIQFGGATSGTAVGRLFFDITGAA